ncbi:MAG: hypothetical protein KDE27_23915, partial [Planctomycetes bacterium]|nr:hypothetical protein [Planctomycetota bacterium]
SGPTWLAHRAGVPLLVLAAAVDRAWRARSWERPVIPKPIARIALYYGDPVTVPADADDAGLEGIATALGETMLADERAAFARLGVADDQ